MCYLPYHGRRREFFANQEINQIGDLKGLSWRVYNASTRRIAQMVEAHPVAIEAADLRKALATGLIQALMTSAATAYDVEVWDRMSYFYDTRAWIPKNVTLMNKAAFEQLEKSMQDAVLSVAEAAEVLAQYHQAQVTVPRLLALLRAFGIIISKRQIVRLLIGDQDRFLDEARDVLRAGLSSAKWITVDDTGARHKAVNGFCTQIGNAHFAWFGTTGSKNRSNFLDLLRAGHDDYVINAEALAYMHQRPGRAGDRPLGRASRPGLCRSGRLDCAPRPAWRPDSQGQSRSRHGCHRGSLVGQHQGAWLFARHGDRQ